MNGDRLRNLKEPDELKPVEALSAGLVAMDFREPGVDRRVGRGDTVNVSETEVAADAVHHRVDRRDHPARFPKLPDVQV